MWLDEELLANISLVGRGKWVGTGFVVTAPSHHYKLHYPARKSVPISLIPPVFWQLVPYLTNLEFFLQQGNSALLLFRHTSVTTMNQNKQCSAGMLSMISSAQRDMTNNLFLFTDMWAKACFFFRRKVCVMLTKLCNKNLNSQ